MTAVAQFLPYITPSALCTPHVKQMEIYNYLQWVLRQTN